MSKEPTLTWELPEGFKPEWYHIDDYASREIFILKNMLSSRDFDLISDEALDAIVRCIDRDKLKKELDDYKQE